MVETDTISALINEIIIMIVFGIFLDCRRCRRCYRLFPLSLPADHIFNIITVPENYVPNFLSLFAMCVCAAMLIKLRLKWRTNSQERKMFTKYLQFKI